MNDVNVILAEHPGLGRAWLCGCNAIHLSIGPTTITLAPEAFVQAAAMIRSAIEQLNELSASRHQTGELPLLPHEPSPQPTCQ